MLGRAICAGCPHTRLVSIPATKPEGPGWYADPAGGSGTRWWDGATWAGRESSAEDAHLPPLGRRFAQHGDLLARLLLANAGLSAFTLVVDNLLANALVGRALAIVALGLLVVTGCVWFAWQWRMAMSAPERLRRLPGVHIGVWFIPVANLWLPIQNIHDLWCAYELDEASEAKAGTHLVRLWWACWVVSVLLGACGLYTLLQGAVPNGYIAGAWALAAVLAWFVVRHLSWRALLYHSTAS